MFSVSLFLDTRGIKPGNPAQVKVIIRARRRAAFISTGVRLLPEMWDGPKRTVSPRDRLAEVNDAVARLLIEGRISESTRTQPVKEAVMKPLSPKSAGRMGASLPTSWGKPQRILADKDQS